MGYQRIEFGSERQYKIPELGGKRLLSSTTITGLLAKPALIQWSASQAIEYVKEEVFDDLLKGRIGIDDLRDMDIDGILKDAKTYHARKSGRARKLGTRVHEFIHLYLQAIVSKKRVILKYEEDLEKPVLAFVDWLANEQVKPELLEHTVWSKAGGGYAGTLDFFGQVRGKPTVLDFKVSNEIYADHKLQVASYYGAFLERNPGVKGLVQQVGILLLGRESGLPKEVDIPLADAKDYLKSFVLLAEYANFSYKLRESRAKKKLEIKVK